MIFRVLAAISVAAVCTLSALAHQVPAWSLLYFPLPHMCICTALPSHRLAAHPSSTRCVLTRSLQLTGPRVRRRYGHQHHQPSLVESQHCSATDPGTTTNGWTLDHECATTNSIQAPGNKLFIDIVHWATMSCNELCQPSVDCLSVDRGAVTDVTAKVAKGCIIPTVLRHR